MHICYWQHITTPIHVIPYHDQSDSTRNVPSHVIVRGCAMACAPLLFHCSCSLQAGSSRFSTAGQSSQWAWLLWYWRSQWPCKFCPCLPTFFGFESCSSVNVHVVKLPRFAAIPTALSWFLNLPPFHLTLASALPATPLFPPGARKIADRYVHSLLSRLAWLWI